MYETGRFRTVEDAPRPGVGPARAWARHLGASERSATVRDGRALVAAVAPATARATTPASVALAVRRVRAARTAHRPVVRPGAARDEGHQAKGREHSAAAAGVPARGFRHRARSIFRSG